MFMICKQDKNGRERQFTFLSGRISGGTSTLLEHFCPILGEFTLHGFFSISTPRKSVPHTYVIFWGENIVRNFSYVIDLLITSMVTGEANATLNNMRSSCRTSQCKAFFRGCYDPRPTLHSIVIVTNSCSSQCACAIKGLKSILFVLVFHPRHSLLASYRDLALIQDQHTVHHSPEWSDGTLTFLDLTQAGVNYEL